MTLGQLLLLVLIVIVFWLGSKLKRHENRIEKLEGKGEEEQAEEEQGQRS